MVGCLKIKVLDLLLVRILLLLIIVLCLPNCSRRYKILIFYHFALYFVHNGISVEFIGNPLQQIVVQTEEMSTKKC